MRTVLLRGADERGLTFYTNYESHKGHDLAANPQAEMLFYWAELERQVRAYGRVSRVGTPRPTPTFTFAPATASSPPMPATRRARPSRAARRWRPGSPRWNALSRRHHRAPPDFWGGYRLSVQEWEFWQGRPNRMHDRFRYARAADGWRIERLMP